MDEIKIGDLAVFRQDPALVNSFYRDVRVRVLERDYDDRFTVELLTEPNDNPYRTIGDSVTCSAHQLERFTEPVTDEDLDYVRKSLGVS